MSTLRELQRSIFQSYERPEFLTFNNGHRNKCLRYCFNMDFQNCYNDGCECQNGYVPVLGGKSISKTLESEEGTGSSDDANWKTSQIDESTSYSGSETGSGNSDDWVSYQSQGCSKYGLGHPSPANTPYKVSEVQEIDWSKEKACWIADKYVRYCDEHWRTDSDSPQKCLEDCQNHEHCQKATWFIRENFENAGKPVCFMFPVGAVECEWDGGQYVRPARGQSIECQGPRCGPRKENCFAGPKTPTYCKYTQKSDEEIAELSGSGDGSNDWGSNSADRDWVLSRDDGSYYYSANGYYTMANDEFEYRCAACPKSPGQCTVYGDNDYPTRSGSRDHSMDINFHQEGWAECVRDCFNMDINTCGENGCLCIGSNYEVINHHGSFSVDESSETGSESGGSSIAFASWDGSGCAFYDSKPDEPPTDKPTTERPSETDDLCNEICHIKCSDLGGNVVGCYDRCNFNCNSEILYLTDLEIAEQMCNFTDSYNDTTPFSLYDSCDKVCLQKCVTSPEYGPRPRCMDRCMNRCFFENDFLVLDDFDLAERVCNYTEHFGENPPFIENDEIPTTTTTTTSTTTTAATNPCDNQKTFECPENSVCIPTENTAGYTCECDQGYYMSINKCRLISNEAPSCPQNFKKDLFKMKVDNLKNPMYFVNDGTALIQVESQIVSRFRLNEETYTGFIEFTRNNCGANFVKAFGAGQIDVQVLDVGGSEGKVYFIRMINRLYYS